MLTSTKKILLTVAVTAFSFIIFQGQAQVINPLTVKVGSHILSQKGNSKFAYENEEYYYDKAYSVPGTRKEVLRQRVNHWLESFDQSQIKVYEKDPENGDDTSVIDVTMSMFLSNEFRSSKLPPPVTRFHLRFSFQDGSVMLHTFAFFYEEVENHSHSTLNGSYYASREKKTYPLNNLRPLTKGYMIDAYTAFDKAFLQKLKSFETAIKGN